MSSNSTKSPEDLLYHVKCEVIDFHKDQSGATRTTELFGTFNSLPTAKAAGYSCLKSWGYQPSDFDIYEENRHPEDWKHGDGVIVYAKAPAGQEFNVRLDTKPNLIGLKGNKEGVVEEKLYYVLQTTIYYNLDRTGAKQATEVEGVYLSREEANKAATKVLLDDKDGLTRDEFAEYDVKNKEDDWPFGEDVIVHAVWPTGENYLVEVKVLPTAKR